MQWYGLRSMDTTRLEIHKVPLDALAPLSERPSGSGSEGGSPSQHASSTAAVGAHGDAHGNGSDKSTLPPLMMIPTGPLIPKPWNAGLLAAAKAVALLGSTTSFSLSQSKRIASMISYMQHRVAHQRDRCNVMPPRRS